MRSEIREQLESFAAVIDDDLFADIPAPTAPARRAPNRAAAPRSDFLDDEEDDDDEDGDLVEYYGMRLPDDEYRRDDDEFDLADGTGRPTA